MRLSSRVSCTGGGPTLITPLQSYSDWRHGAGSHLPGQSLHLLMRSLAILALALPSWEQHVKWKASDDFLIIRNLWVSVCWGAVLVKRSRTAVHTPMHTLYCLSNSLCRLNSACLVCHENVYQFGNCYCHAVLSEQNCLSNYMYLKFLSTVCNAKYKHCQKCFCLLRICVAIV